MKIITVLGARPQFIKSATVSNQLENHGVKEVILHTGQHFDKNMSDIFFDELGLLRPSYNLDIHGGRHGEMTGRMLIEIEKVVLEESPDFLLVYGDTNSTLAGALVGAKLHIPVVHIESGLRSFNMKMPEEINRILTDRVSSFLFTPTQLGFNNLLKEGFSEEIVHLSGDVMLDAALHFSEKIKDSKERLAHYGVSASQYILATIHRAENTDVPDRLKAIFEALREVSEQVSVVLPLHPRTRQLIEKQQIDFGKITVISPVGYLDMINLEKHALLVVTDSGGVQKEAFFFNTPCCTLRDETEWTELISSGWNVLCPPLESSMIAKTIFDRIGKSGKEDFYPYGKGNASEKIVNTLLNA